jgi:phage baseplate assembly protein gpV
VEGLHAQLDGEYVVALARHVVDRERGYVTEISTELPPRRPRDTGFLAIPGKVSRTDDPEKLGRVRLTLPTLADLETDWMCVTAAGAGGSKGLMALPDVDDHVFALVSAENPAVGIVVGSVYGSGGWPDTGLEDNAVKRFTWLTPGGQRFRFDDTNNSVRVENKSGSYVELLPDHLRLHSVSDMTIEAPGRTIVIQGKLIDFRSV